MPSRKDRFFAMLQQGFKEGAEGAGDAYKAKTSLEQLLAGKNADRENKFAEMGEADRITAARQEQRLAEAQRIVAENAAKGRKIGVTLGDGTVGLTHSEPHPMSFPIRLTPAQESAEKAAGKQIADFDAAGGRPALEKTLQSLDEVASDLDPEKGNRDGYDRVVGGALNNWPLLMGLAAPTEKARRDNARSTAVDAAKKSDPNPTQQQIDTIMGQIYDPSSTNEANAERIKRFKEEQTKKALQMEQASKNYKQTGYATMGAPGAATPPAPQETPEQKYLRLKTKYPRGAR